MTSDRRISLARRRLLGAAAACSFSPAALLPASFLPSIVRAQGAPLTPACGRPTARQTAGPFFKPESPARTSLVEKNNKAGLLVVSGQVLSASCKPVANALLDFWHADEFGDYDNQGFSYRGHQLADAQGRWRLETILPAEYPGRARHIHVNVQAPGKRILTTQLYFPEEFGHHRDGLYKSALQLKIVRKEDLLEGRFDFVVDT
jgi:protocatechuate 3,4-dioxygenase beta subunit